MLHQLSSNHLPEPARSETDAAERRDEMLAAISNFSPEIQSRWIGIYDAACLGAGASGRFRSRQTCSDLQASFLQLIAQSEGIV